MSDGDEERKRERSSEGFQSWMDGAKQQRPDGGKFDAFALAWDGKVATVAPYEGTQVERPFFVMCLVFCVWKCMCACIL